MKFGLHTCQTSILPAECSLQFSIALLGLELDPLPAQLPTYKMIHSFFYDILKDSVPIISVRQPITICSQLKHEVER